MLDKIGELCQDLAKVRQYCIFLLQDDLVLTGGYEILNSEDEAVGLARWQKSLESEDATVEE